MSDTPRTDNAFWQPLYDESADYRCMADLAIKLVRGNIVNPGDSFTVEEVK